jgi:asparagine synthetase B (glutamine-hydrolysing)
VVSQELSHRIGCTTTTMRDVIAHRGPDDAGLYVDERAGSGTGG